MQADAPVAVHLEDYQPTDFAVPHIDLRVILGPRITSIMSRLHLVPRTNDKRPLVLDGEGILLASVAIDEKQLSASEYTYVNNKLTIHEVPENEFKLVITQVCDPEANTALSGLYLSNGTYCTQMEAEGFRRFAFMYDRPDVMSTYTVRISAPSNLPVILCNGNLVASGRDSEGDYHFAEWHDPHPKPTYLFALVAGDLASLQDSFTTMEGREVSLGIYVEKGKEDRCDWAMECLKASMRWDEQRFGRAYDLDVFNIVAVSDFNMGAMENKGLNIFNDKYILARPDTATDVDHINIERIIAHEYFHNWTGNRITCRDWFQLCLKEGLTVYRDQEFTSDLRSRAVKRIEDVKTLRARQFPEDQGPLAHAVRPSSYIEINNFYTPTIYEKGAEICRMLHTLLGDAAFRSATDLYFERHDGEAATVEDFLNCMANASGRDLQHFSKWYEQAGTPIVEVTTHFDESRCEFRLELSQETPKTPGQSQKLLLQIPLALALLSKSGEHHTLTPKENVSVANGVFEFTTAKATLTFPNISKRPVLSINRGFSAPIILKTDATEDDLLFQMARDDDSFNRWEAAQTCAKRILIDAYYERDVDVSKFSAGLSQTLADAKLDNAFKALMLQLPSEAEITVELKSGVDASRVHTTRKEILRRIAKSLSAQLQDVVAATAESGAYQPDVNGSARRSLRFASLALMSSADPQWALSIARSDFDLADNMTCESGAIASVLSVEDNSVDDMLEGFYQRHGDDHLLVDKWFLLKAARVKTAKDISALLGHPAFTFKTPNRVYALLGGFTGSNLSGFHADDGSGYRLLGESIVTLNGINPQVAARMANSFRSWKRYDEARMMQAAKEMQIILQHPKLSNDVYEIISRTLNG
jgi:aminopeptidase N